MKILLLAPTYLDLYLPVKEELEKQGNDVFFIEDITPAFYPYYRKNGLKNLLYKSIHCFRDLDRLYKDFWDAKIADYNLLSHRFDCFICINGTSLHPYFLERLRENNPGIIKRLYLWDTNKYYDFERFIRFFDKCYTFDLEDSQIMNISYLPFYYIDNKDDVKEIYDAFCIGTLHDNRLAILKCLAKQLDELSSSYYFKVVFSPVTLCLKTRIIYYVRSLFENKTTRLEMKYKLGLLNDSLLSTKIYSLDEYNSIMKQSRVIIDTDRESQKGLTPRLVWAIALGKTIITTNKNLLFNPYCPKKSIWIIDRDNPVIKKEMLVENDSEVDPKVKELEIGEWVKKFYM